MSVAETLEMHQTAMAPTRHGISEAMPHQVVRPTVVSYNSSLNLQVQRVVAWLVENRGNIWRFPKIGVPPKNESWGL